MVALSGNSFRAAGDVAKKFFSYEIPNVLKSEQVRNALGDRVFDFRASREKPGLF